MLAFGSWAIIAGARDGAAAPIVVGAILIVLNVGISLLQVLLFRPLRWRGTADEQLTQLAEAAVARLPSAWRYGLERRDGFGFSALHVATFVRGTEIGPVLWFENAATFWVTLVLPNGDKVSGELWRTSSAAQERIIDVVVSLCTGQFAVQGDDAVVETSKRPVKLPVFPGLVVWPAKDVRDDD